jgi:nucleoside-diphosphate-sugar epimerase
VEGDLRDAESLKRALEGVEAVAHLGGITTARSEREYMAVNAEGSATLVAAAREAGVRRFVYVSSLAAGGPSPDGNPVLHGDGQPISAYGRSKAGGEQAVLAAAGEEMSVAIVRPPAVYGPRDRGFLPLYRIARLGVFPLFGDGNNQVSFIHVYDAAEAITQATLAQGLSGAVYTICDGKPHTWREAVAAFAAAVGRKPLLIPTPPFLYHLAGHAGGLASAIVRKPLPLSPEKVEEMRQRYWVCDNAQIYRDLGWQPQLALDQGMRQTVAWYRENGWL